MNSGLLINRRDDSPCRKCKEGHLPECRSACQRLKDWQAEGEKIRAARRKYCSGLMLRRR